MTAATSPCRVKNMYSSVCIQVQAVKPARAPFLPLAVTLRRRAAGPTTQCDGRYCTQMMHLGKFLMVGLVVLGSLLSSAAPDALAAPVGECHASASNQVETSQCLQDTFGSAQAVMATALAAAQNEADAIDQVTGRSGARLALDQAQAMWLEFRDVNCMVPAAFAAGGSGSGQFTVSCQIDMTRARTIELRALA